MYTLYTVRTFSFVNFIPEDDNEIEREIRTDICSVQKIFFWGFWIDRTTVFL